MVKITKRDIVSAWITSHSPLVVQVKHTDGSCDSYTVAQQVRSMTAGARIKVRSLIEPGFNG